MFRNKVKFKIGEFSKLSQVTIKTLRHYEEIKLLIPFETDQWTGYRYYDISQLEKMSRIIYLKKVGFSLEEIKDVFDSNEEWPDTPSIKDKIDRCQNDIQQLLWRHAELEKLRDHFHKNEKMENIFVKRLPARTFATHRRIISGYSELFNLCPNIIGPEMHRLGCECPEPQYCFTIEHNGEYTGHNIDIEYFEAVAHKGKDSELIKFIELPEVSTALCMNHYGAYEDMPKTFAMLYAHVEENGYKVIDLPRFNYLDGIWNKENVEEWLTEIQIPVSR